MQEGGDRARLVRVRVVTDPVAHATVLLVGRPALAILHWPLLPSVDVLHRFRWYVI